MSVGLVWLVLAIGAATSGALVPGCYQDCLGLTAGCPHRLLPHTIAVNWPNMTLEVCADQCRSSGFSLAGVEAAYGCFCGNANASSIVAAPSTDCCAPCTGNSSQFCGDKFRIWVYPSAVQAASMPTGCKLPTPPIDPRNIFNGTVMLEAGYLDQPYCDILRSGRWVCTITYDGAHEGGGGEHIAALWSDDAGVTWSKPVSVEPAPINTELANAYSMTVVAKGTGAGGADRTYAIYNMNVHNVTRYPSGGGLGRVDMLGDFVMRYSDDGGETWSDTRYTVPNPIKPIDKGNEWGGNMTIMWTVDQTKVRDGTVYFGFTKIGKYILGPPEELWVLASDNLLTVTDAADAKWTLLPDADHGISLPPSQYTTYNFEEAHVVPMVGAGAPGFYIEGRTTNGYLVASETNDGSGKTGWAASHHAQYYDPAAAVHTPLSLSASPFGGPGAGLKNPRGPTTVKRFDAAGNGKYLLLYYNNHDQSYTSRDPYWLAGGVEVPPSGGRPATILFSQPEIMIYDATDKSDRPGYPDFIEHVTKEGAAAVFITETQKTASRLHRIPSDLLDGIWTQDTVSGIPPTPAVTVTAADQGGTIDTPPLPALDGSDPTLPGFKGLGFAVAVAVEGMHLAAPGARLFDSAEGDGSGGIVLAVGSTAGELILTVGDGHTSFNISTDAVCSAVLATPGIHFFGAVLDGGPRIATVMVDGVLCDGAAKANTGWKWFPPLGAGLRGGPKMAVAPSFKGKLHQGAWWTRMVSTSEMVGCFRALTRPFVKPAPRVEN